MFRFLSICCIFMTGLTFIGAVGDDERVQLKLNTSEAEAVVAILNMRVANREPSEDDWNRLFSSAPYQTLKQREEAFHNPMSDNNFRQFVLSSTLAEQSEVLQKRLVEWSQVDLGAAAQRVLSYLPPLSVVKADVYLVINPRRLLAMYNKAVSKNKGTGKEPEELWSPQLLKAVRAPQVQVECIWNID
jgi:hypothetical protein